MNKGFTLSEILISLAIVGIISVLTMPTLSRRIYYGTYTTTLQSTIGMISEGIEEALAEQHVSNLASLYEDIEEGQVREQLFLSDKVGTTMDCGNSPDGCFAPHYKNVGGSEIESFTKDFKEHNFNSYVTIKNGASIGLTFPWGNPEDSSHSGPGEIVIDVNGIKPPNTYGLDAFKMALHQRGDIGAFGDAGSDETIGEYRDDCLSGTSYNFMCYYYLLNNDWKIDY